MINLFSILTALCYRHTNTVMLPRNRRDKKISYGNSYKALLIYTSLVNNTLVCLELYLIPFWQLTLSPNSAWNGPVIVLHNSAQEV